MSITEAPDAGPEAVDEDSADDHGSPSSLPSPPHSISGSEMLHPDGRQAPRRTSLKLPAAARASERESRTLHRHSISTTATAAVLSVPDVPELSAFGAYRWRVLGFLAVWGLGAGIMTGLWGVLNVALGQYPVYFVGAWCSVVPTLFVHLSTPYLVLPPWVRRNKAAWRDVWWVTAFNGLFLLTNATCWVLMIAYSKVRGRHMA